MTGIELKVQRIRAEVKAKDLAEALGWSASKVSLIERRANVPPADAEAYVAKLATFSTNSTGTVPQEGAA
jgi:hypothetical protein